MNGDVEGIFYQIAIRSDQGGFVLRTASCVQMPRPVDEAFAFLHANESKQQAMDYRLLRMEMSSKIPINDARPSRRGKGSLASGKLGEKSGS